MTGHEQAKCSRQLRLQQETSDGQWLSDDRTERTARAQMTTEDGDDLAGLYERAMIELIQIRRHHAMLNTICHQCKFEIHQFRETYIAMISVTWSYDEVETPNELQR